MPRRLTSSKIRTQLRQVQAKQRQAIRTYNNTVRQRNSKIKQATNVYNREVRAHNARVRAHQSRLQSALRRLSSQTIAVPYASFYESSSALSAAYKRLDNSDADPLLSDLAERDTANSVTVLNTLLGDTGNSQAVEGELNSTRIAEALANFSAELNSRWSGAIFALNPNNPDAARHFCTSAREIIADILNSEAPDPHVLAELPDCPVTKQGTPTRRAKIQYCLNRRGKSHLALEGFIETNISDLTVLFKDLNSGAHGPAGRFTLLQLSTIKTRVEDAIEFICEIVA